MSAPVATLPAAENDSRPARPVCYVNRAGAVAHMWRAARQASPSGTYHAVEFVDDTYQPTEGGTAYRVALGPLDWEVREVSPVELERLVQSGIRSAVEGCYRRAKACDYLAKTVKFGGAVHRMHLSSAAQERNRARELELKLTVTSVRVVEVVERANELCLGLRVARLEATRLCPCGKPSRPNHRRGLCMGCDEDESERVNRALPKHLQRD